jgi:hypothetical protein
MMAMEMSTWMRGWDSEAASPEPTQAYATGS